MRFYAYPVKSVICAGSGIAHGMACAFGWAFLIIFAGALINVVRAFKSGAGVRQECHVFQQLLDTGVQYGNSNRNEKAIEALEAALSIRPDSPNVHYNLGIVYQRIGRHAQAIDEFRALLRAKPDHPEIWHSLGVSYGELKEQKEAINAYKQALKQKPDLFEGHYNIAACYFELGDYGNTIRSYQGALNTRPEYAPAIYYQGEAYLKCGDIDAAIRQYDILKGLDNEKARSLIELINRTGGGHGR